MKGSIAGMKNSLTVVFDKYSTRTENMAAHIERYIDRVCRIAYREWLIKSSWLDISQDLSYFFFAVKWKSIENFLWMLLWNKTYRVGKHYTSDFNSFRSCNYPSLRLRLENEGDAAKVIVVGMGNDKGIDTVRL